MEVFSENRKLRVHLEKYHSQKKTVGFVPTMGALHQGHLSLVEESKQHNDITVVSIFVNPTQFDNANDLLKYPRTFEKDKELLESINCDILFAPTAEDIYEDNVTAKHFDFDGLENEMEGKYRDGHFDGVGTIVKALFEIVQPTHAYFGEKDFQQLQIIKKMVEKSRLDVSVVGCPIHREDNGLAMSSRNERLSSEQRKEAKIIYEILQSVQQKFPNISVNDLTTWVSDQFEKHPLFELEYFTIANETTLVSTLKTLPQEQYRAFIAVYANSIRLIDNISLKNELSF